MAHGAETRISGGATADEGPSNGGRELCRRSTPDGCEGDAAGVLRPGRASSAAAWPRTGAREPSTALSTATPPRTNVREPPQASSAAAPSWKGAREPPWPSSTVAQPQTGTSSWSGGLSPTVPLWRGRCTLVGAWSGGGACLRQLPRAHRRRSSGSCAHMRVERTAELAGGRSGALAGAERTAKLVRQHGWEEGCAPDMWAPHVRCPVSLIHWRFNMSNGDLDPT